VLLALCISYCQIKPSSCWYMFYVATAKQSAILRIRRAWRRHGNRERLRELLSTCYLTGRRPLQWKRKLLYHHRAQWFQSSLGKIQLQLRCTTLLSKMGNNFSRSQTKIGVRAKKFKYTFTRGAKAQPTRNNRGEWGEPKRMEGLRTWLVKPDLHKANRSANRMRTEKNGYYCE